MGAFDFAVHGFGLIPGLLALHLAKREPECRILVLCGDARPGGDALEAVVESSLSPSARGLVEPLVVAQWPAYLLRHGGEASQHSESVLLLDPVQLWLELQAVLEDGQLCAGCTDLTRDGLSLHWNSGTAQVTDLIDLTALTAPADPTEIIGMDAVRGLPLPVLADLDTGDGEWSAFQHIPLGDERVYIRKRRCSGDPLTELTEGFGQILNKLVS